MKIAIAQISTDPGAITNNSNKIVKYIKKAKKLGAEMIIFPELTIPGYMSLDLILQKKFVQQNLDALKKIIQSTDKILAIVGFIDQDKKTLGPDGTPKRYNSAAIIYNKKLLAVQDKTLLPDYDIFFENRYFSQGRGRKLINFKGLKLGIQICEDLWDENYPIKVSKDLVQKGADLLINISGSPFYVGKRFVRENLIKKNINNYKIPFIYVNTVGCQDGYDGELVFDGQSMVFNKSGNLINLANQFEEDLRVTSSEDLFNNKEQIILPNYDETKELFTALTLAVKDYFRRTNFKKAFIGLSGGIDSAVMASIAMRSLGKENVTGILMPSKFTSKQSINDAKDLAKKLDIKLDIISIQEIFSKYITTLKKNFKNLPQDTTEENIQARIRGMLLMAHSNKFGGLVISTANKTETALGYATLYGDMCGAIAPLADVSKLKVYELAKFINETMNSPISKEVITKSPTAELKENQTDENSLGAKYSTISPLVDDLVEGLYSTNELNNKYSEKLVKKIDNLIIKSEYKRRQASPAVKVTKKAFGIGRRIPISHDFKLT